MSGVTPTKPQPRAVSSATLNDDESQVARKQAAFRLRRAAQWLMATHPHGRAHERAPLDRYGSGVLIRFDPPGVLRVFDWNDGQLLAESVAGAPDQLSPDFEAPAARA